MKKLKIAFGVGQILHQNTPKIAQTVGNIGLLLAGIAAIPLLFPFFGLAVPVIVTQVATLAAAGGVGIKKISKLFGIVDAVTGEPLDYNVPKDASEVAPLFKNLFKKLNPPTDSVPGGNNE